MPVGFSILLPTEGQYLTEWSVCARVCTTILQSAHQALAGLHKYYVQREVAFSFVVVVRD
jgi:hypothetical protein